MDDKLKNEIEKAKIELAGEASKAPHDKEQLIVTQPSSGIKFRNDDERTKRKSKKFNIIVALLIAYLLLEVFLPYNAKAIPNGFSEILLHFQVLPVFLTHGQKDKITAQQLAEVANDVYKESNGVIDEIGAAANYPDNTSQPLTVVKLTNDTFKLCANFSSNGSYDDPSGHQNLNYIPGNNCFTYSIDFAYGKDIHVDKGAYISAIDSMQKKISASGKSNVDALGDGVTGTYKDDTKVYDKMNKEIPISQLKIGNTADFYWKAIAPATQEPGLVVGGRETYIYKIVVANDGLDPRYCPKTLKNNSADPLCPDTYLNLSVLEVNPDEDLYAKNANGIQIYVYWTNPPALINAKGKTIPLSQLAAGQIVDVIWHGDQPVQLKVH